MKRMAASFVLSSSLIALPALAQLAPDRALPRRPKPEFIHKIPNGSNIDLRTGDVTLNGAFVANYDLACAPDSSDQGQGGGYYAQVSTAEAKGTLTDNFGGTFTVPGYPTASIQANPEYWSYWPGLVAWNWPAGVIKGASGGNVVLQPVLNWSSNGATHSFSIRSAMNIGGCTQYDGPTVNVNPGDVIESFIYQYAGNPDSWEVMANDLTIGYYSEFTVSGLPATLPKFNTAYVVLEGFSGVSGTPFGPLPTCADLPPLGTLTFNILTFDEPTPNWNSYKPWTGSNLWTGAVGKKTAFPTTGPDCGFKVKASTPDEVFTFSP